SIAVQVFWHGEVEQGEHKVGSHVRHTEEERRAERHAGYSDLRSGWSSCDLVVDHLAPIVAANAPQGNSFMSVGSRNLRLRSHGKPLRLRSGPGCHGLCVHPSPTAAPASTAVLVVCHATAVAGPVPLGYTVVVQVAAGAVSPPRHPSPAPAGYVPALYAPAAFCPSTRSQGLGAELHDRDTTNDHRGV